MVELVRFGFALSLLLQVVTIVSGAIVTDYYRADNAAAAALAIARKGKKGKNDDETTCVDDFNVVYLSPGDVCGAMLDTANTKYIIDADRDPIVCIAMDGPTVTNGAILDCDGAEIVGDGVTNTFGVVLEFDSAVQNCKVSDFLGGFAAFGPLIEFERQVIYNSEATNNEFGIYSALGSPEIFEVDSSGNLYAGLLMDSSETYISQSQFTENGFLGIQSIQSDPLAGINIFDLYDTQIEDNNQFGLFLHAADAIMARTHVSGHLSAGLQLNASVGLLQDMLFENNANLIDGFGTGVVVNGTSFAEISRSVITGNFFGLDILSYPEESRSAGAILTCVEISENAVEGVFLFSDASGPYSFLDATDSDISRHGSANIDVVDSDLFLRRTRACNAGSFDILGVGSVLFAANTTTCDVENIPTFDCAFGCEECEVGLPEWCSA